MIRIRPDISRIRPYLPGKPIIEVAGDHGFDPDMVVKLASNESPLPPLAAAQRAMMERIGHVNRYPDNEARVLRQAIAKRLGVGFDSVWVGAGSSEVLRVLATALGGPGTSAVYGWPSFVVYRLATSIAGSRSIEVPLDKNHRHDLPAMLDRIDESTTVVYVCNPNNPTGTVVSSAALSEFISAVPPDVAVLIDEAYHEYATDTSYHSALELVPNHPNLIVSRTFSKIYGLASLRVGYGVAHPAVLAELRKAQAPFSVTDLGQVAAVASLSESAEIDSRGLANRAGREMIEATLSRMGIEYVPSQANFVYFRLGAEPATVTEAFLRHAVILRPFSGGWIRVSVGTEVEIQAFIAALEIELANFG